MNHTFFDSDCIVVGSGPAGVSVAFALIESGVHVLMLDGANDADTTSRHSGEPWKRMLGSELEALLPEDGLSPKLRTPVSRQIVSNFQQACNVRGEGFVAIGAKERGGLSHIWGGLVCEYDAGDIEGWPLSIKDMRSSYGVVTNRIGVSGSTTDEMADFLGRSGTILPALPIGPSAVRLLERYRPGSQGPEFGLGLARNTILSVARDGRSACDLRKDCLWGCKRGAIYDARFDLKKLKRNDYFRLLDDAHVVDLRRVRGGWEVSTKDGRSFAAPRIVIAAGTLGTAALLIQLLPNAPAELPLLSSPAMAMPILVPARLGYFPPEKGYSLAQLVYRLRYGYDGRDFVTGAVYEIEGLPASFFTARLPLSRRAGTEIFNFIAPALLVATGYFPGTQSDNKLRWQRNGNGISVVVRGGVKGDLSTNVDKVLRRLRKIWWRLGGLMLPGTSLAQPGTDAHFGGLFPMGLHGAHGTDQFGELNVAPGVFVADGAALPTVSSKFVTLTIMANADRIGRHIARAHRAT
jgi:choline dehydrogenase-like flavoprotein